MFSLLTKQSKGLLGICESPSTHHSTTVVVGEPLSYLCSYHQSEHTSLIVLLVGEEMKR